MHLLYGSNEDWWIFDCAKCIQSEQLSAFFHWSQFTELNFCQVYPAGFAGQGIHNKDFNPLAR
jgi:hypothetical protein